MDAGMSRDFWGMFHWQGTGYYMEFRLLSLENNKYLRIRLQKG